MVALGYVEANEGNQTADVALRMRYLVAALFAASALLQFVGIGLIYNLDKKSLAVMNAELEERRAPPPDKTKLIMRFVSVQSYFRGESVGFKAVYSGNR